MRFCTIVRYFGECSVAVVISNRQVYGVSSDFPLYSMNFCVAVVYYFAIGTKTRNIKNIKT